MAKSSKKLKSVPQSVTFSDDDGSMEEETLDFGGVESDYGKENADSDGEDDDRAVFDDDDVEGDSDDYQEDTDTNSEDDDDDDDEEEEKDEIQGDGVDMQNNESKDAEMEELEKEYSNLHREEEDIWRNLRRHKDEDLLKGQAVKNQKALWDKALQFRFLLQKPFSNSNKLPQEPVRYLFQNSFDGVDESYSDLIISTKKTLDSLLQLQEALMEKNPSITHAPHDDQATNRSLNGEEDEEWFRISQMQSRMASFRDKSVDKWQRRTQVTSGAAGIKSKFQAFNQNISEQVASYMRDPSRMIKGMQQRKSAVPIFGHGPDSIQNNKDEALKNDGDPDLLDDSEFYQHLLKEFLETFDSASSEIAFYALKRLQTKKRKIVDRRASKSRKIRYNVHEKIVNFMAPQPMNIPPMAPKLFEDLFGLKSQKANSAA